jgi:hypothetical protein
MGFSRNYFTEENSVDSVHELIDTRPPAASISKGASQGAEEEEWDARNSFRASPGGGRWRGGRASRQRGGGRGGSVGVCSGVGEEERRAW